MSFRPIFRLQPPARTISTSARTRNELVVSPLLKNGFFEPLTELANLSKKQQLPASVYAAATKEARAQAHKAHNLKNGIVVAAIAGGAGLLMHHIYGAVSASRSSGSEGGGSRRRWEDDIPEAYFTLI